LNRMNFVRPSMTSTSRATHTASDGKAFSIFGHELDMATQGYGGVSRKLWRRRARPNGGEADRGGAGDGQSGHVAEPRTVGVRWGQCGSGGGSSSMVWTRRAMRSGWLTLRVRAVGTRRSSSLMRRLFSRISRRACREEGYRGTTASR
jgi:hypothetical protein